MAGPAKRGRPRSAEGHRKSKCGMKGIDDSKARKEEMCEEKSVMDDLQDYLDYRKSTTRGTNADSDSEASDADEDSDALDSIYSSSDSGDSSGDEELLLKQTPGRSKNCGTRKNNNISGKSRTQCPNPAPPLIQCKRARFRGGNDIEESGASKSLIQLLRTRTTLNPAPPGALVQLNSSSPTFKVLGKTFDYVKSRVAMENWAVALKLQIKEEPEKVLRDHFRQVFVSKLRKQMKKEWLYWAEVGHDSGAKSEFYSCWKTMLQKFVSQHPVWMKHKDEFEFNELLEDAGFKCLRTYYKLISRNKKIIQQIETWRSNIEEAMEKKLIFMKKFRALEVEIENKDKKLDEFCHWGKKQLQSSFMAPYFKINSMDYTNLVPPKNFVTSMFGDAWLTQKKQKWTTKDTQALKKIILEVILDKEYAELMERYNYLASRITYDITHRIATIEENRRQKCQNGLESEQSVYDHSARVKPNRRINMKKRTGSDVSTTTIQRVIPVENEDFTAKALYTVRGTDLQQWFQTQETAFRGLKYEVVVKQERFIKQIDWFRVAERITSETGKDRCANDCRLVWLHDAHPDVCSKRWSAASSKKLMELGRNGGKTMTWQEIANEIGGKTAYQCFFKFRNRSVQTEIMKWDEEKDRRVNELLFREGPKWGKAVEATLDPRATKHQVQERWKKCSNPILRNGAFTRVEDALLLLSIERLRGFLQKEGHFGIFMAYLPWRFETVWRDRANNLFSNWIVPWTIEEDRKLLELVESQKGKKNWTEIAEQFTSFKNRKGCLTRYKILLSKVGPKSGKFKTLEEYHEAYSMTRYNVFQYTHLREVVDLLKRVDEAQSPGPFRGLSKERPPSEMELRWLLLDYDKLVIRSAVRNLENYINTRDTYWKDWTEKNGKHKKTFDRRTFHRHDPKSVASAVHIRGLKLIPTESLDGNELKSFESEVYFHYARFSRTKALKVKDSEGRDVLRRYLPSAKKLGKLPEIKRIIVPLCNVDETDSGSDWNEVRDFKVRKRGRPKKSAASLSTSHQPERKSARKSVKRCYLPDDGNGTSSEEETIRKEIKKLTAKVTADCGQGRIPKRKRGRPRKSQDSNSVTNERTQPIKRKRVQPMKARSDVDATPSKHRCTDKAGLRKSQDWPQVSFEEPSKYLPGTLNSGMLLPKAKRGRPRKSLAPQQLSADISIIPCEAISSKTSTTKRLGRPPKSIAPLQLSAHASIFPCKTISSKTSTTKRRGRPPKSLQIGSKFTDINSEPSTNNAPPPPKKRNVQPRKCTESRNPILLQYPELHEIERQRRDDVFFNDEIDFTSEVIVESVSSGIEAGEEDGDVNVTEILIHPGVIGSPIEKEHGVRITRRSSLRDRRTIDV